MKHQAQKVLRLVTACKYTILAFHPDQLSLAIHPRIHKLMVNAFAVEEMTSSV